MHPMAEAGPYARVCLAWAVRLARQQPAPASPEGAVVAAVVHGICLGVAPAHLDHTGALTAAQELTAFYERMGASTDYPTPEAERLRVLHLGEARKLLERAQQLTTDEVPDD